MITDRAFNTGCTGARQIATALSEAKRENKKVIVTSMCIGYVESFSLYPLSFCSHKPCCSRSGMGMASVIVNEQ